ncbi:MAG TPA: LysM domain-containing protein [Ruminiclostridium sp.]|nr:LysM domain-containing protein [Ruminiclostridium sp.]
MAYTPSKAGVQLIAYRLSLGGVQMPIAPSKVETKIKNQNKTMNLIDGNEVNIIKPPGLTEYSFELMIPKMQYPFADYPNGIFQNQQYYLNHFEKLKTDNKPFKFHIEYETTQNGTFSRKITDVLVSLEEYSIVEDAGNGMDLTISVSLKQYREYKADKYKVPSSTGTGKAGTSTKKKESPKSYTVKKGDTLWAICKKFLGDGSKYPQIAKLNGIKNPNLIRIGQVIKLG